MVHEITGKNREGVLVQQIIDVLIQESGHLFCSI